MRWKVHGSERLYDSWWLELDLTDVELPDGTRIRHEVVRSPRDGSACVVVDPAKGVLLIRRHRFIADRWGWELPGGMVEPGERPEDAAAREVLEETGWRPRAIRRVTTFHPSSGWSDQRHHLFWADGADYVAPPVEVNEASRSEWRSPPEVLRDLEAGEVPDGLAQFGLAIFLARAAGTELAAIPWSNGRTPTPHMKGR